MFSDTIQLVSALFLVIGGPRITAEASSSWATSHENDVYPYYTPSATTLSQFGVNQRQTSNRRQLAVALANLLGNPAFLFSGIGVRTQKVC